ncbi:MAG TPA: VWA domain-containing protein [Bacteroidales bacterium]|nr:VWA domain-containing protein [Bacteroidales bacterium]HRZ49990.1 VWA domain-containing protein [Bacteroidales bacterium]
MKNIVPVFVFLLFLTTLTSMAQTISFRISERTLELGDSAVLKWNVQKTKRKDSLSVTGIEGMAPFKGEMKVSPEKDIVYTLTHVRRNKVTRRTIKVKVNGPEIIEFEGPDTVLFRSPCLLHWKTRFATEISVQQEADRLPAYGSLMVMPSSTVTYTLQACNRNKRCVNAVHHLQIRGDYVKGPTMIRPGETGFLEWRFIGASGVRLHKPDTLLPQEGTLKINPRSTEFYHFTITRKTESGADSTYQIDVKVPVVRSDYITGTKNYVTLPTGRKLVFDIFSVNWKDYPDEIVLKVMITDTLGNYITGLAPPYLTEEQSRKFFRAVIETVEGKSYPILDFRVTEIRSMTSTPHDIALVLDYSGSMNAWFQELDEATRKFIQRKHKADRLAIVRFDDSIGTEAPLSGSIQELESKVTFNKGRDYGGSTALNAASDAGMRLLPDSMRDRHLIIMTDGYENSSMFYWGKYYTFATEVLMAARKKHITLNTINFRGQANRPLLEAFADMTGGKAYELENEKEIEKVFFELQHLYHNYYEIRYKPAPADGNRQIELLYADNTGKTASATTTAWIKDSMNIEAIEKEGIEQSSLSPVYGKKMILQRQVVALFEFDRSDLDSSAMQKLEQVVMYLKANPGCDIVIQGHSDLVGDEAHCRLIGKARAEEVYNYLRGKGISASRMTREGKGKTEPVWPVEDLEWKARENRRVEVLFLSP